MHEDSTARKQAEEEIRELSQPLERRIAERTQALRESEKKFRNLFEESRLGVILHDENGNFVPMVSHEFRTPLGIIQSSADILNDYIDHFALSSCPVIQSIC